MKLFISRNREDIPAHALKELEAKHELCCRTLIRFEFLDFTIPDSYDFIFFSSERAVTAYFRLYHPEANCKCICVGKRTAAALEDHDVHTDLVFEKSGDPEANKNAFLEFVKNGTVLFPVSDRTHGTYADMLTVKKRLMVTAYRTVSDPQTIAPADAYIFTSPSNLHAFLQTNTFPEKARCIAWGNTTAEALRDAGITPYHTLENASFEELAALTFK